MNKKVEKSKPSKSTSKINIKRKKFIKGIMEGKKPSQAARDAGYKENTALYKSGPMLREEAPTIQALMEKRGLTDDRLLDVLERGLEATKVISCNIIAIDKEGMKDADSMTKDFVEVPDFATQHKYLDTALTVKDKYPSKKLDVGLTFEDALRSAITRRKEKNH